MKIFSYPDGNEKLALLFDMDNTLYTHDEYARTQEGLPIERLAKRKGKTFESVKAEIAAFRADWAAFHNGQCVSLGNIFLSFGISIEENIVWREELCRPEDYLAKDARLYSALRRLQQRFSLAVVTNNPVTVANRVLSVLGVNDIFKTIVGLDTCRLSKPNKEIFLKATALCGVSPTQCVSIGDRYDIDIALPLELGMSGILVRGVEDVYELPAIFVKGSYSKRASMEKIS